MRIYDIIKKKRDKCELTDEEIKFFVSGAADSSIPDYQLSAMLMAIYFNGMSKAETAALTLAMARSGDMVDLSALGATADKHSTGGVGDKTTLIVAPIVAACGIKVAKMSGRGLGHTGGTVDKFESIPGYKTDLSRDEFFETVKKCGMSIIGQSGNLTPADKKLYALRDVTATVESIPLIASSVMSKKLAAGAETIVLDVKVGSGSFMKTEEQARTLARAMIDIGNAAGRKTAAVLSNMDMPLGKNIGNSLEVKEAIEVLKGGGAEDLRLLCIELAATMLSLSGKGDLSACRSLASTALESGRAFSVFRTCVAMQGGDISVIDNPEKLPKAKHSLNIYSPNSGYIAKTDVEAIGTAACLLGAGRKAKEDSIDYAAGIIINAKVGDKVCKGDLLATLFANDENLFKAAKEKCLGAITFSAEKPSKSPIIIGVEQ